MLETVLTNVKINAVPINREDYSYLTQIILENPNLSFLNVAHIVRSLAHTLRYDMKLHTLVVKQFGFQQQTRIFSNALSINGNDEIADDKIGILLLKDFMIQFGLSFELFLGNDEYMMSLTKQLDLLGNYEDNIQYLKPQDNQYLGTMISPLSSQQLNEAKQQEAISITKISDNSQSQYYYTKNEHQDTSQNKWDLKQQNHELDNCDDLVAHEDINQVCNNAQFNHSYIHNSHIASNQQQNRYPQYNGLQFIFNNNKNQKYQTKSNTQAMQIQTKQQSPEKNKTFIDMHRISEFKLNEKNSLISANNSIMNTPIQQIRDHQNCLYPYNSSVKPKSSAKLLFGQNNMQESPKWTPPMNHQVINKEHFNNARPLFQSANKALPQSPQVFKSILGQKRLAGNINNLESQINNYNDGFTTPVQKRQKSDPFSSIGKTNDNLLDDSVHNQSSDSEEEKDIGEINDNVSSASRKKRGLKILSVKVQELVYKKKETTYKDVANELIKQLRENKKSIHEFGGIDGDDSVEPYGDDDEDMSNESPNKRSEGRDQSSSQQKWEKNVRRRVYDALNVLYAAGVLKKDGKNVSCDNKVLQLQNRMKDQSQHSQSKNSQYRNSPKVQDQKKMDQIENLKQQLSQLKQRVEQKRVVLSEQFKHFVSYKHLIQRNIDMKQKGYFDPNNSISLPFILVSTKDCPDNEVEISFGEQDKSLNIAMKKPMKCIGDSDTLIKLGLYKVNQDWVNQYIPESNSILRSLNEKQRQEILQ